LERAARLTPSEPSLLHRMADLYRASGELDRATKFYEELLEKAGANPGATAILRQQLIQLYYIAGRRADASRLLREVVRENPNDPRVHYLLGSLAAQGREPAEAVGHFERAVALDASFEPAYYDLAISQLSAGQVEAALATLEKARERFKLNFQLEFVTGIALAAAKRYTDALKSYTSAELLARSGDPDRLNHIFYFQVGAANERAGRYEEAEAAFRRCLELAPDYPEALNYLGYMWAERGVNLEEARDLIAKAVAAEPESAAFLDSMAWVLFKLGKPAEALEWMERALQHSEKPDATLLDHHGDILWALGRDEEARAAWRKSLEVEASEAIREKLERKSPQ
jgi:tetratricopeptide (TPR) repeat protein